MILYDSVIRELTELTGKTEPKHYKYDSGNSWEESKEYELLLQKETAFELGGDGKTSVNCTCVTTTAAFLQGDETVVVGPELCEISESVPYARITLLLTTDIESDDEDDTETAYKAITDMDFVKYHVYPKGFMVRTSGLTSREQVRVGKKAIENGISFEKIGNTLINHYKENENVRAARIIFITAPDADYEGITRLAKKTSDITKSLSKILEGMPAECASCGIRDICDEVEGLKELHFGKKKNKDE